MADSGWRMGAGDWGLGTGGWGLGTGDWGLGAGDWGNSETVRQWDSETVGQLDSGQRMADGGWRIADSG